MRKVIRTKQLVLMALLVALMVVIQSLRFVLPMPMLVIVFIIGTLLNAILLICYEILGLKQAYMMSFLMVLVAFLQQSFWHPLALVPALAANLGFVFTYHVCLKYGCWVQMTSTAAMRGILIFAFSYLFFDLLGFNNGLGFKAGVFFALLQIITGLCGIVVARKLSARFDDLKV